MKIVGQLLLIVALLAGALSASTAYHAWLDLPDDELIGLTLNDDAGSRAAGNGKIEPLLKKGQQLTQADLELLRESKADDGTPVVAAVRVKEFSFARWQHRWGLTIFVAALAGMIVGSVLTRIAASKAADGASQEQEADFGSPQALVELTQLVADLSNNLQSEQDKLRRLEMIVEQTGDWQSTYIPMFAELHTVLIRRLGVGPAAEVMDRFAGAERQINRAWSAASDGDAAEAADCLNAAREHLEETRGTLQRKAMK